MAAKIYNADEVSIVFGVVPISGGWGDGEFCRIEMLNDAFEDVAGTDGEVTRTKTNDRRATITITLMQTSSFNAALSLLHEADKNTAGGTGVLPLLIKDNNGVGLWSAKDAWIVKAPDLTFDRGATSREWVIRCAALVRVGA